MYEEQKRSHGPEQTMEEPEEGKRHMKTVPTFTATICCGLQEGYDGRQHAVSEAEAIGRAYCDKVGLGLTCTPTLFTYTSGGELGCLIGLINYPRFPSDAQTIKRHAFEITKRLMRAFKQERMSIVFTDETVMLEKEDLEAEDGREQEGET